ncbi:MAG TPA: hypothetical protein VGJ91_18345, partial [Polyangiaceae bacterium]
QIPALQVDTPVPQTPSQARVSPSFGHGSSSSTAVRAPQSGKAASAASAASHPTTTDDLRSTLDTARA